MKKLLSIVCCVSLLFCATACGKEPGETATDSSPADTTPISTEPQQPYWDTHEPLSYAGIYNGQRFSGDYVFPDIDNTKTGDVYFTLPKLVGKVEDISQPFLTTMQSISEPFSGNVYYDKKNNRYINALQTGSQTDEDGYPVYDFKTNRYYYNDTSCTIPGSEGWSRIEADDEYVVYVYGPKEAEEENKSHKRIFWKKGVGLLGFYDYYPNADGEAYVINIRFTSKTADGWDMSKTIVPKAQPGAKRVWPEKLWPAEYNGLDDPKLRAILEEY